MPEPFPGKLPRGACTRAQRRARDDGAPAGATTDQRPNRTPLPLDNLRRFIKEIDRLGELVRIPHPVRARLEIAEIADRCMKSPGGGPALLFEHVLLDDGRRSPHPVAINLFGSMRRMCLALGVDDLDSIGARIADMLNLKVPEGLFGKLAMLPKLAEIGKFPPRIKGGRAPCHEVILRGDAVNLDDIPFLTTW